MSIRSKFAALLMLASLGLAGCTSAPQLGLADTRGFNARGATVLVEYTLHKVKEASAEQIAELRTKRRDDVHQLLKSHGFHPVTSGQSAFTMRVAEGDARDVTGEWTGAIGVNLTLFTLGIVPALFEYRADVQYELWSGQQRLHAIATPATWKEALGLVSIVEMLSGSDASRERALHDAHDSVIRLWIDQGSFDQ